MGNFIVRTWDTYWEPELNPEPCGPTTFDPHLGFENKRKERVMIATEQELRAAKIPQEKWDFCAHLLLEIERCKADNWPFVWRCKNEIQDMNMCNLDDHLLRMMEYERERRLLQRAARKAEKAVQGA